GYHGSSSSVLTVVVLAPLLATAVLATRGSWRSPGWRLAAAIGVLTIGVPIAAKVFGQDFFFPRNVIASWIPLAVAGGGAVALRRGRRPAVTAGPVRDARVLPGGFRFAGRGSSPGFIFERYVSDRPRTLSVGALSEVRLEPAHSPTILQEPR